MTTRRAFLAETAGAVAGLAFVGCGLLGPRPARAQGGRRSVTVAGRRVKTIDIHAHCVVPEALALMSLSMGPPSRPPSLLMGQPQERLAAMDAQGIDVQALSINPFWYKADRDVATRIVQIQNEKLAQACAATPDRFVAFASVALRFPELAAVQLEEGVRKYGLRGAAIGGSVNGEELSHPKFHPFWAKAERLDVPVFIHPQGAVELNATGRLKGAGGLDNVIGNPLETTIALSHLIFEGTLDRFPTVKICAAHGGGYLPSYAGRSDAGCVVVPARCSVALQKKPSEYLRRLYFDSLVFTPEALRHLAAETGPGQIVMGTDYPYPWTSTSVDHILATPGLGDTERAGMLGDTAARLLGIRS